MKRPSLLDKVLVVALHEQRPSRDREVNFSLRSSIDYYRENLEVVSGPADDDGLRLHHLKLYEPRTAFLWGVYDYATFYIGDDLESVVNIANSCNASSQEFIFGSPYSFQNDDSEILDYLGYLFDSKKAGARPVVAVSRIKMGDHLLAIAGSSLEEAMAAHADRQSREQGVIPIILRCWAWSELVLVLLSDDPIALIKVLDSVEQACLADLCDHNRSLRNSLCSGLGHPIGRHIVGKWIYGRTYGKGSERTTDELLTELLDRDVVVSVRTQFGITESGWEGRAETELGGELALVFLDAIAPKGRKEPLITRESALALANAVGNLLSKERDQALEPVLQARIVLQVKPGHLGMVLGFAEDLARKIGPRVRILGGHQRSSMAILMEIQLAATVIDLFELLCLITTFRICGEIRTHLQKTETELEWIGLFNSTRNLRRKQKWSKEPTSGFGILLPESSEHSIRFERKLTGYQKIGRVEAVSIHSWFTAISQITTRPEMFGSMVELQRAAHAVYIELMHRTVLDQRQQRIAGMSTQGDGYYVARAISKLSPYFQLAYQQRLQFSPIVGGAPPINGQLPYGVNQIVKMVDGVAATILSSASFGQHEEETNPDLPSKVNLVCFGSDPAIATTDLLGFGLLTLSLVQAFSPISLCLLFHELGHVIIRRSFWNPLVDSYPAYWSNCKAWREEIRSVAEKLLLWGDVAKVVTVGRLEIFLVDIFAHATWRRVGCRSDESLFSTQLLAGQAMGLRTNPNFHGESVPLEVWAETLAHLLIQDCLKLTAIEGVEDLGRCLRLAAKEINSKESKVLWRVVKRILEFADAELEYMARTLGEQNLSREKQAARLVSCFMESWAPVIVRLDENASRLSMNESAAFGLLFFEKYKMLFERLEEIELILDGGEKALIAEYPDFARLAANVEAGGEVLCVPWSVLRFEVGASPAPQAVVWVREILRGVTGQFIAANGPRSKTVRRGANLELLEGDEPFNGVFADFIGGLFVSGWKARSNYLSARLAAIRTLSELAVRVQATSIALLFQRARRYNRINYKEADQFETKIFVDRLEFEARVLDQSPIGGCVFVEDELGMEEGKVFEVLGRAGKRVKCIARRTETCQVEVIGMKIGFELATLAPEGDPIPQNVAEWIGCSTSRWEIESGSGK